MEGVYAHRFSLWQDISATNAERKADLRKGPTKKVASLNLEQGGPTVEQALLYMKNALATYKRQGLKAVIVIHGWGSSGVGGAIRPAVRNALRGDDMRGLVRAFVGGEEFSGSKRREFIGLCKALEDERHLEGNAGVTVVLLR